MSSYRKWIDCLWKLKIFKQTAVKILIKNMTFFKKFLNLQYMLDEAGLNTTNTPV